MAEALALRHVSAGYGDTVVLEDVSLALEAGESISVIGRNGVGKSTLLATVMGHTTLHGGEVLLGGASLARVPVFRRARSGLGFVPQEREIFPSLTVRENLAVGARPGPWTAERVFDLFPNLGARLSHAGSLLSGGEQQMLSIARALVTNPSVLLMDEPTEGLAPVIVEALAAVLLRLRGCAPRARSRSCSSSRTAGWRSRSPPAPWSWTRGASSTTAPRRPSPPIPNASPSSSAWSSLSARFYRSIGASVGGVPAPRRPAARTAGGRSWVFWTARSRS